MADIIIILILAAVTLLIIRSLFRDKGGCGSCGNDKNGCGCGCNGCQLQQRKEKDNNKISKK